MKDPKVTITNFRYTQVELAEKIYRMFKSRRYRLARGTKIDGMYAKGWFIFRYLFGSLAKRFRFEVKISDNGIITLTKYLPGRPVPIVKMSSSAYGMSGGGTVHPGYGMRSYITGGRRGQQDFEDEFREIANELRRL